jgi:hypothetical protein
MKVLQETTVWQGSTPNHIYFTNDSKSRMFAYVKAGSNSVFKFSEPLPLDVRKRQFREIPDTFGFSAPESTAGKTWQIQGSKGDIYVVTLEENVYNCTCSGFQFRGTCRHIKGL